MLPDLCCDRESSGVVAEVTAELRRLGRDRWGSGPVRSSGKADRFSRLFGARELQELLRDVRVPVGMYRVLLEGQPQPHASTSTPLRVEGREVMGALDPGKLRAEMRRGASLLLAGLDEYWPPVRRLCAEVARRTGLDVSAFAVVSPPGAQGFHPHVDKADQLVLQCEGTKRWSVWAPKPELLGRRTDDAALHEPAFAGDLRPGEVLYLPRGAPHAATAGDSLSIHVTLICFSATLAELAEQATSAAAADLPETTATLPPFWFEDPGGQVLAARRVTDDLLARAAAAVSGELVARSERLSRRAAS